VTKVYFVRLLHKVCGRLIVSVTEFIYSEISVYTQNETAKNKISISINRLTIESTTNSYNEFDRQRTKCVSSTLNSRKLLGQS